MINPHSDTVSTLSPVRINCQQSQIRQLVAVDTVTVSLTFSTPMTLSKAGDFCHKNVECRTSFRHSVDSVECDNVDRVEFDFVTTHQCV